eukprot:3278210-Prymnesium_polylepis.1
MRGAPDFEAKGATPFCLIKRLYVLPAEAFSQAERDAAKVLQCTVAVQRATGLYDSRTRAEPTHVEQGGTVEFPVEGDPVLIKGGAPTTTTRAAPLAPPAAPHRAGGRLHRAGGPHVHVQGGCAHTAAGTDRAACLWCVGCRHPAELLP